MFHRRMASLIVSLICLGGLLLISRPVHSGGVQSVSFINVGQGDAILLRDGNGFDVLVDGGKRGAADEVLAYLRAQGVTDLDYIVATHPDADHVGGLIGVLGADDIPVLGALYNGCPGDTQTWNDLLSAVAAEGLTPLALRYPAVLAWGEMSVYVLHPAAGIPCRSEPNEDSLVLRVDHGTVRYLLTGDIDSTIEATVVARLTPVAAQVLKVSHHGSASASSAPFLSVVDPFESVISVGKNSYGHPEPETLTRLTQSGSRIWRTDRSGTIRVESDGSGYWVIPEFILEQFFLPVILSQD